MPDEDLIEFAPSDPSDASLASASALARRQLAAEDLVAEKEAELAAAEKELALIRDELLPKALEMLDSDGFPLPGGFKVTVGEKFVCGQLDDLPEDAGSKAKKRPLQERLAALALLESTGHGDLAKRVIAITLGNKAGALAQKLLDFLRNHPEANSFRVTQARTIPWNTLSAFAKERRAAGEDLDLEKLGVSVIRRAVITRPKAKADAAQDF